MPSGFHVSEEGIEGIKAVVEVPPDVFQRLGVKIAEFRLTLDVESLSKRIASEVGGASVPAWGKILRSVLIPLNQMRADHGWEPQKVVEFVTEAIDEQSQEAIGEDFRRQWRAISEHLLPLFVADGYFSILSKALDLLGTRPALLLDAKILTDLRPVYDESACETRAMVLTNTLVLEYRVSGRRQTLHVTLDLDDLRTLSDQVDRATRKNQTLLEKAEALQREVLTYGEFRR